MTAGLLAPLVGAVGGMFGREELELRRRSGSLVASAGAHRATDALGVLFGLMARRLDASAG